MLRFAPLALLFPFIAAQGMGAQAVADGDLQFHVAFANNQGTYRMGEPITIEVTYSTESENKYWGHWVGQTRFAGISAKITPAEGSIDPETRLEDRDFEGSIVSSDDFVTSKPHSQSFDFSSRYRFEKPGRYEITLVSTEVCRVGTRDEGRTKEPLTLESQPLQVNILPADSGWVSDQLAQIGKELSGGAESDRYRVLFRLGLLDTPASVARMIQIYFGAHDASEWQISDYLRESAKTDQIVDALHIALRNPALIPPASLVDLLADLETRQQLGVLPDAPSDPAKQSAWYGTLQKRQETRNALALRAENEFDKTIHLRPGRDRIAAVFQEWNEAEDLDDPSPFRPQNPGQKVIPEEKLSQLRSEVLASVNSLSRDQKMEFLTSAWSKMPHDLLLPLVLEFAKVTDDSISQSDQRQVYQFWCEGWRSDCERGITSRIFVSTWETPRDLVLLLEPGEHTQFDSILKQAFRAPHSAHDAPLAPGAADVLLRTGSRNLIPYAKDVLTKLQQQEDCFEYVEGDLIGYLYRFAPEDASKFLGQALRRSKNECGSQLLQQIHESGASEGMIPIVTAALDSSNLQTVAAAAQFLGQHGRPEVRDVLWQRLETLWREWSARANELRAPFASSEQDGEQTAELEAVLASVLMYSDNWKSSDADKARLLAGCLTSICHNIAEGKMSFDSY